MMKRRKFEIKDQTKRMQAYINALSEIFDLKNPDAVYWIERTGKKKSDHTHEECSP